MEEPTNDTALDIIQVNKGLIPHKAVQNRENAPGWGRPDSYRRELPERR